jgi:nucleoside phosphorylase
MSNLLVFATEMERDGVFPDGIPQGYDCLISGVGILSTTLTLGKTFQNKKYDNAIQIGIAGAYTSSGLELGDLVEVISDCLVEFLPWEPNTYFSSGTLPKQLDENIQERVKYAKGATVLRCANTDDMDILRGKIAHIETMEGAAFFAVCKEYGVQATQIRTISNYTGTGEREEWKTEGALLKLKEFFIAILG